MRLKLKVISATITCALGLIAAGATLANPACPSASFVKNIKLENAMPGNDSGFYILDSGVEPPAVTISVKANNIVSAYQRAKKMQSAITRSYSTTSKPFPDDGGYYCRYQPYDSNYELQNKEKEFVEVDFFSDNTAVSHRRMFLKQ